MAKIELKGTIHEVSVPFAVGENNTPKQTVIFQVPGYVDGFGDTVGDPELWRVDVIGKKVDELKIDNTLKGQKATLIVYVNSSYIVGKDGKDDMFIINANLSAYKLQPAKV